MNSLKHMVAVVFTSFICILPLYASGDGTHTTNTLSSADLNRFLNDIAPWPDGETTYSDKNWLALVTAAKYIQSCDPASVESTVREYQNRTYIDKTSPPPNSDVDYYKNIGPSEARKRYEDDSKFLLLMRVTFDLPEHQKSNGIRYFGWKSLAERQDGTMDLNWPIRWANGRPRLVSGQTTLEGAVDVYNVLGEYKYFSERYRFRNLDAIKIANSEMNSTRQP